MPTASSIGAWEALRGPLPMNRPLKLPTKPARERAASKALWNDGRSSETANFYTLGYEGRKIGDILDALKAASIRCIMDIRHTPLSMYRPEVSKTNFQRTVEAEGIQYLHVPECGVPKDIRAKAIGAGTRDPIWEWYDEYVVERFFGRNLHWFLNLDHPVAMMCVEADPTECHRHRLFNALERQGLRGFDL
jgi:uncharacterized protein (DUF488 family)